jgi:hypothetical protein
MDSLVKTKDKPLFNIYSTYKKDDYKILLIKENNRVF